MTTLVSAHQASAGRRRRSRARRRLPQADYRSGGGWSTGRQVRLTRERAHSSDGPAQRPRSFAARHSVDNDAALVSPRDCIDDCSYVGGGGLAGQVMGARSEVEATTDPGQLPVCREALQRLVNGGAGTEI